MSKFYNPRRTRNVFDPLSKEPFRVSRSKIDLFLNCPRCFYLDRRHGVSQPPGYPFALNSAVDKLLKKEFDIHRAKQTAHPLMASYGLDAVPFAHERIEEWRDSLRAGITYHHGATNFIVTGGVDDVWEARGGELIIVDYKSTSKDGEVSLDADWQIGYKRQMEVYQWLFRQNGFRVSPVGYFVYCNGQTDRSAFDAKLDFNITLIPYTGDPSWIEDTLQKMFFCLRDSVPPPSGSECDFCLYRQVSNEVDPPLSLKKEVKRSQSLF